MLDDLAGTEDNRLQRRLNPPDRHFGLGIEPKVHPLQEPTTTNQVDALDDLPAPCPS